MIKCNLSGKSECLISGDVETLEREFANLLLTFFFGEPDSNLNPNMEFDFDNEDDIPKMSRLILSDLTHIVLDMMLLLSDKEYMENKRKMIAITTPINLNSFTTDEK